MSYYDLHGSPVLTLNGTHVTRKSALKKSAWYSRPILTVFGRQVLKTQTCNVVRYLKSLEHRLKNKKQIAHGMCSSILTVFGTRVKAKVRGRAVFTVIRIRTLFFFSKCLIQLQ